MLAWEPPHRLVLTWQINGSWQYDPDPARASEIEIRFTADGPQQTLVELHHRHLDRLIDGQAMHDGIDQAGGGWSSVLQVYAAAAPHRESQERSWLGLLVDLLFNEAAERATPPDVRVTHRRSRSGQGVVACASIARLAATDPAGALFRYIGTCSAWMTPPFHRARRRRTRVVRRTPHCDPSYQSQPAATGHSRSYLDPTSRIT